jgi:hypothetical protein
MSASWSVPLPWPAFSLAANSYSPLRAGQGLALEPLLPIGPHVGADALPVQAGTGVIPVTFSCKIPGQVNVGLDVSVSSERKFRQ